jgi:hypothetical protein
MAQSHKARAAAGIGNAADGRTAEAAKIARLRAQRLAKEAEDRDAAASIALAAPAKVPSPRAASSVRRNRPAG